MWAHVYARAYPWTVCMCTGVESYVVRVAESGSQGGLWWPEQLRPLPVPLWSTAFSRVWFSSRKSKGSVAETLTHGAVHEDSCVGRML